MLAYFRAKNTKNARKYSKFKLKNYLIYDLISVDAIFDQVNAVNETLTSDFETLHNDMDAMELKHEQAIGKYLHVQIKKKVFASIIVLTCPNARRCF